MLNIKNRGGGWYRGRGLAGASGWYEARSLAGASSWCEERSTVRRGPDRGQSILPTLSPTRAGNIYLHEFVGFRAYVHN